MTLKSLQKCAAADGNQIMMSIISQTGVWDGGVGRKKNLPKEVTEMTKSWDFKGTRNTVVTGLQ